MSLTRERATRACEKLEHDERLRDAEQQSQCAIRRARFPRVRSKNERTTRSADSFSCFHDRSYTQACKQCGRSAADAAQFIAKLKLKLSIA